MFGDDVEVDVHHFLMGFLAIVLEDVVGVRTGCFHESASDSGKCSPDGCGGVVAELVKKRLRFLGNHEEVARAQWSHIKECEDVIVFVEFVTRDFTSEDSGENGVFFICLHP